MLNQLHEYTPQGRGAPPPGKYGTASTAAKKQYLAYDAILIALCQQRLTSGRLSFHTDFGDLR